MLANMALSPSDSGYHQQLGEADSEQTDSLTTGIGDSWSRRAGAEALLRTQGWPAPPWMCSTRDNHGGLQILKKYPTIALAFSNADSTPGLPGRFDMPPGWHWATTAEAAMVMGATTAGDTRHWLGPHGNDWNAENFLHRGSSKSRIRHKCGLSCYQTVATMRNGACGDFGRVCCDCVGDCVGRRRTPAANQNFPHSQLIWTRDCNGCERGLELAFGMMQSAAGAVISNGKWKILFFSQVLVPTISRSIPRTISRETSSSYSVLDRSVRPPDSSPSKSGEGLFIEIGRPGCDRPHTLV